MTEEHEDKGNEPVVYELGYHLVPSLGEEDLALRVGELKKVITDAGGTVFAEGAPEMVDLAYTISKQIAGTNQRFTSAYFGWLKCEVLAETIPNISATLAQNSILVRYLLVHSDRVENVPLAKIRTHTIDDVIVHRPDVSSDAGEVSEEELTKAVDEMVGEDAQSGQRVKGKVSISD
jgi:ribosomal protein S6